MNRRQFGGAAVVATAAAFAPSRSQHSRAADQSATPAPSAEPVPVPAEAVALRLGQSYAFRETFTIRFIAVVADERCPRSQGVVCDEPGDATVVIEVDLGEGRPPSTVEFVASEGAAPQVVWGARRLVVAIALTGDSATPREDVELRLIVLAGWPGDD